MRLSLVFECNDRFFHEAKEAYFVAGMHHLIILDMLSCARQFFFRQSRNLFVKPFEVQLQ